MQVECRTYSQHQLSDDEFIQTRRLVSVLSCRISSVCDVGRRRWSRLPGHGARRNKPDLIVALTLMLLCLLGVLACMGGGCGADAGRYSLEVRYVVNRRPAIISPCSYHGPTHVSDDVWVWLVVGAELVFGLLPHEHGELAFSRMVV